MSANFIVNFSPLLIIYAIVLLLSLLLSFVKKGFSNITDYLKENFLWNGFYIVFFITLQEELLYIAL